MLMGIEPLRDGHAHADVEQHAVRVEDPVDVAWGDQSLLPRMIWLMRETWRPAISPILR